MRALFEQVAPIRAVKIATKGEGDAKKSLGFGFVEFSDKTAAATALKTLQGKYLDAKPIEIKISDKKLSQTTAQTVPAPATATNKIIIKNLPFQATKKEVRELFR